MAEIPISTGCSAGSIRSISMTADASTSPPEMARINDECHRLIDEGIHIPAKAPTGDRRRAGKGGAYELGRHERPLTERHELSDGPAVPCDDEGLSSDRRD